MTKEGRNDIAKQLKNKWESQYFNERGLNPHDWCSSEKTYDTNGKTNGCRTLYHMIISEHAKQRRYIIGQNAVQILTTIPEEIKGIENAIEGIGLVRYMKEKYGLEIDQIKCTNTDGLRREIEIVLIENDDEGCVGGDDILKEEDRLKMKWQ